MKPRSKFLIGGVLVLGTAGYLAASAIKDTGVYYLTPGELSAKTTSDPTFYETGVKVGARVVNGSIVRDPGGRQVAFKVTDGAKTYDVVYRGITPDTFTDDVDVVLEGRLGRDGTFRATTLLAKCASRYENAPEKYRDTPGYRKAHTAMGVTDGEFSALVEDLVAALNHFNVPKREQDDLLAALGTMKGDIVEVQSTATGTRLPAAFEPAK